MPPRSCRTATWTVVTPGRLSHIRDYLGVLLKRAVGKVQACHVHACRHQPVQSFRRPGGRTNCGDYLGFTHLIFPRFGDNRPTRGGILFSQLCLGFRFYPALYPQRRDGGQLPSLPQYQTKQAQPAFGRCARIANRRFTNFPGGTVRKIGWRVPNRPGG